LGLAAVGLFGTFLDYLSLPLGLSVFVLSLGGAVWVWRRSKQANIKPELDKVESGLRIVEKPLPGGKPKLAHGLRVTISTEMGISLGLRVVCDQPVSEVEPLAQTGRGSAACPGGAAPGRGARPALD